MTRKTIALTAATTGTAIQPFARCPLPERTRATLAREHQAIETALTHVVGPQDACRLIELGNSIRRTEHQPDDPPTPAERAERLMETQHGRGRLRELTWRTV